ncbi:hypothetical protein AA313_de0202454 [Arthrobotrys entomopaga]|nr:hypothetical protein AA313_de0202454 [Arthrobotrys entomopaga]
MFDNNTFPSNAMLLDALCPIDIDAAFGPFVKGCRDDFDFTLAFEEYFFAAAPSLLGLVLTVVRIAALKGRKDVVRTGSLLTLKLVSHSHCDNQYSSVLPFPWPRPSVGGLYAGLSIANHVGKYTFLLA